MKKRTIGPTLRIAEAVTGPRENDTHIGRIAQRLAEIRHMITLEDCIGMCGLTEEAIAEHEHLPEVAATALAHHVRVGTTHRSRAGGDLRLPRCDLLRAPPFHFSGNLWPFA